MPCHRIIMTRDTVAHIVMNADSFAFHHATAFAHHTTGPQMHDHHRETRNWRHHVLCFCLPAAVLHQRHDDMWRLCQLSYCASSLSSSNHCKVDCLLCHKLPKAVERSFCWHRYMVLPQRPAGTDGWSEEQLQALVTRDSMIGVTFAKQPEKAA